MTAPGVPRRIALAGLLLSCLPATAGSASLKEYPGDLVRGVREELRPEGILTLLTAGGAASVARFGGTTHFDDSTITASLRAERPLGVRATDAGAVIGYPGYLMPLLGAVYAGGWYFESEGAREAGLSGVEALSLAGLQTLVLKFSVHRVRPDSTDLDAFPSGHTSASFSLAALAASEWGWRAGVPACLAAGFVGYTRLESNKHYLSDVLFGAGVGIASGRAIHRVRRRAPPSRLAFAPILLPTGGGVRIAF